MNIQELHQEDKVVSAISLFKGEIGSVTAIQIVKGEVLKKHMTKTDAMLICLKGIVVFENENELKVELISGDYINIERNVVHWLTAKEKCQLVLFK